MKILVVHSTNNITSGAEFAIVDMLRNVPNDLDFEMYTPGKGELSLFLEDKGFKVHTIFFSGPRRKYPGLFLISSIFFSLWIKKNKFDIILCNTFAASYRISLAAKICNIKCVIYTREYFSKQKEINFLQIKRAHSIIAVSKDVSQYYEGLHKRVYVNYDTINIRNILSRVENKTNILNKNDFNVVFLGRLTKYKQPELLLKAASYILKSIPNLKIHVIGNAIEKERSIEKQLKILAIEKGIIEYVKFWGHRNDSIELLSEMDVLCLTSDREPFPRTILESMLCRTNVVCSNTGGCTEMIEDNKTGLYFDVNNELNYLDLSKKIIHLFENKNHSEKLKNKAFEFVQNEFGSFQQETIFFDTLKTIFSLK
jgi:glycosyltransferase involved in cell wall biosynthesis